MRLTPIPTPWYDRPSVVGALAMSSGKVRYGKVCEKHPELLGRRYGYDCTGCHNQRRKESRALGRTTGVKPRPSEEEKAATKLAKNRRQRQKLRTDVFNHYGNRCCRCGIDDPDVLTIDHIAQDGAKHRRSIAEQRGAPEGHRGRHSGYKFYQWLRANGFPPGFRTLCFNCNMKAFRVSQQ